jgi:hypothetical protein
MKTPRIPAIVLTCQKYIPLAAHMMDCYRTHWPHHPFVFRLPQGSAAESLAQLHPNSVSLHPTEEGEGRGRFKASVLGLLAGVDDEDWVYWCLDDKYVTRMNVSVARRLARALPQVAGDVAGLSFARARSLMNPENLAPEEALQIQGMQFLRRLSYTQIWLHQFLRAKVLRHLFGGFPDVVANAKDMDELINHAQLPDDHRLYVISRNAVQFGESTTRGKITANCAASLRSRGGIPVGFETSEQSIFIGRLPTWRERFAGMLGRGRKR